MSTVAPWPTGIPSRADLRVLLLGRHVWLASTDHGPQAVEAGECDRCGAEPRLTQTCGPSAYPYLGRRCALELGEDAWCEGHAADAQEALRWLSALDDDADDIARLWWLTTGEVRLDRNLVTRWVRAALPAGPT
jgi:hypothetical protein